METQAHSNNQGKVIKEEGKKSQNLENYSKIMNHSMHAGGKSN
jgi:hypothetical protein